MDGGAQYVSKCLKGFYDKDTWGYTTLYTTAKQCCRKKESIDDEQGKNLPKELRGEAVSTNSYLLNKCPTKKLEEVIL